MKKTLITVAALMAVGFIVTQALAWYQGGPMGAGYHRGSGQFQGFGLHSKARSNPDWQAFLQDTLPMRQELAVKRMELNTLLNQPDPDPDRIAELRDRIDAKRAEIQSLAEERNLQSFQPGFRGASRNGYGYGRKMGRGGPGYCWR
jgi:hypothetical protein